MGFVATLDCVGRRTFADLIRDEAGHWRPAHQCTGRVEVCHEGRTGKGLATRCPDSETIPMCTGLHRQWTEHRGWFGGWTKQQRREWAEARIAETTALYLSHGSRRG